MVPAWNCGHYLEQILRSVLEQDQGPDLMQLEVVDDSSDDDPEAVVARFEGRVEYFRQPKNVGVVRNLNTCLERSRGELVHLLHGDDAVVDGFYRKLGEPFDRHTELGAAFCRYMAMDSAGRRTTISPLEADRDGILDKWLEKIAVASVYSRRQSSCAEASTRTSAGSTYGWSRAARTGRCGRGSRRAIWSGTSSNRLRCTESTPPRTPQPTGAMVETSAASGVPSPSTERALRSRRRMSSRDELLRTPH